MTLRIRETPRPGPLLRVAVVMAACAAWCASVPDVAVPVAGVDQHRPTPDVTTTVGMLTATPEPTDVVLPSAPSAPSATTVTTTTLTTASATVPTTTTLPAPVTGWDAFDLHLQSILDADPVTVTDRFRVASISKVVTAIALLRLVESGLIDLDESIGNRLASAVGVSSPAFRVSQITPRNLLTHRSGIPQFENLMFRREVESCREAGAAGLSQSLDRDPGTTFRYSNLNFCLLGLLIEDITGRPYTDVARDETLAPLGLDTMRLAGTFDVDDGDVEHQSDAGRNYMEVLGAAGSWIASPTDIATIINSLDLDTPGWKPLEAQTIADMRTFPVDAPAPPAEGVDPASTTATLPPPPETRGYGLGLMVFGPESFGHTGTLESTHAMAARQADGITWAIAVSGDFPSSTRDLAGIIGNAMRLADIT
jgi:D-alanyl-D-alanine carboxypeptidase